MTLPPTWLCALRKTTEPALAQVDRVGITVEEALQDVRSTGPLLRGLPAVPGTATERVLRRALGPQSPPSRRHPAALLAAAGLAIAVVAGALLLARRPPAPPALPPPLKLTFAAGYPETVHLGPDVVVESDGAGRVEGTEAAPFIRWDIGSLDIVVTPGRGVALTVVAAEGRARVHGTAFSVTRDPLGFEVAVREGAVELACLDGTSALLLAGDALLCPPVRPAGLLGRAQTLRDRGRIVESLAAIAAGLSASRQGDPVRGELLYLQALVCAGDGRRADADQAATAYLSEGYTARASELHRLLADTELETRGTALERR